MSEQMVETLHAHNEHQAACPHCEFAARELLDLQDRIRWLEGRLGEVGKHVRLFLVAPSGTTICACHNTHAVAAGLERPCWYCVARSLLPPKGAGDE